MARTKNTKNKGGRSGPSKLSGELGENPAGGRYRRPDPHEAAAIFGELGLEAVKEI